MFRILLTSSAKREYKRLPKEVQQKVRRLLNGPFQTDPFGRQFNIRKVQKPFTGYRMRLGEYRLLFELEEEMIIVYRVKHRKDAYR